MNDNKNEDKLLNSNYDGIEEFDNSLPRWWVNLFYITIIFGVIYTIYFHFGFATMPQDQVAQDLAELGQLHNKNSNTEVDQAKSKQDLLVLVHDEKALAVGKAAFESKCAVCHGVQGQGIIGPNLTDNYWIHGGEITEIKTVIENGVLDKGMLAWKSVLKSDELESVVAYIWSLKGSNPANPKAPQGNLVE
jgi:cytochrome c oxidase cbb3-type subunit 3